jgi:hypothetical protein
MVFSDTATKLGIVEDIDFILNTDSTSYPLAQKTRNCNNWYERVVSLIFKSDGRWEYDDNNKADEPIYTPNLVANTQAYAITAVTFLKILKVECKDQAGNWIALEPISLDDMRHNSLTDFMKTAGTPQFYDKFGNKMRLYPTPSYSSTSGLKIYYQRTADLFASTDTTKVPGFASPFHKLLSLGASLDYCLSKGLANKVPLLREEIAKMERDLQEFYSERNGDEKSSMSLQHENYGSYDSVEFNHFPNS